MDEIEFPYQLENRQMLDYSMDNYSEKLKLISNEIDERKRKHHFLQLLTLALIILVIGCLLFFDSSSLFAKLILLALALVFVFIIFLNARKLKLLYSDARKVALKLEKIVRAYSQNYEHAIRNEVQRTELDLHLAKSESVLEHYYRLKAGGSR